MQNNKHLKIGIAVVAATCLTWGVAQARVSGQCSTCHTMHNSQDGAAVVGTGPYEALTKGDCLVCHTGDDNSATVSIPKVQGTTAPTYETDTLAGGSFWWVSTPGGAVDAQGHNVDLLLQADDVLGSTPPGDDGAGGPSANAFTGSLTCAGTSGCHGDRSVSGNFAAISGSHHTDDTTIDGVETGSSYRFLKGVLGIEDNNWEFDRSASDHNQYYGVNRGTDTFEDTATISALCSNCHGNFHSGSGNLGVDVDTSFASPWIRHPTDIDLGVATGSEYALYNDPTESGTNNYNPDVPVATDNLAAGVQTTVLDDTDNDAIVTCVSCHRAHGSPNNDLLRWSYSTMDAHSSATDINTGCFVCHTTKDDQ